MALEPEHGDEKRWRSLFSALSIKQAKYFRCILTQISAFLRLRSVILTNTTKRWQQQSKGKYQRSALMLNPFDFHHREV